MKKRGGKRRMNSIKSKFKKAINRALAFTLALSMTIPSVVMADHSPVDQGPAPDGAGNGVPFGSSAPSNDKKGEFNEVPGLVVQ